jgi:hypothetical protein
MSENRALRGRFATERNEVSGSCTSLHIVELHNLLTSQNIVRMIKSRRMVLTTYVAHEAEMISAHNETKSHLKNLGVDGTVVIEYILKQQNITL